MSQRPKSSRPEPRTLFGTLILAMALVSFTSGCVFIPTPAYYAYGSRHNVTKQTTKRIEPGTDTIEEVILKLGEPDDISPDEHRISYRAEKIAGLVFPIGADALPNSDPSFPVNRSLNIAFDNKGVVTNRQFSTRLGWTLSGHSLWMLTGSIGGEEIEISSQAEWLPDADGSRPWEDRRQYRVVFGSLMLTESKLHFTAATEWLNGPPTLSLRYDLLAECHVSRDYRPFPTLVVRTKDNHLHSFAFVAAGRPAQGRKAAESACKFIQARIHDRAP